MRIEGDRVYFSSGKTHYANRGIIGITPELELTEGYDGTFYEEPYPWELEEDTEEERAERLTHEDLVELADHLISLWQAFREKYVPKKEEQQQEEKEPVSERDTRFLGFAKALLEEIEDYVDEWSFYNTEANSGRHPTLETLIARRAYDFANHVIYYDGNEITCVPEDIPDMTEFPLELDR